MQFTKLAILAAAFFGLSIAVAVPAPAPEPQGEPITDFDTSIFESAFKIEARDVETSTDLEKRTLGNVYLCQHSPWGQPCVNNVFNINTCYNFNNEWRWTLSSVGPDCGTWCIVYANQNCGGNPQTEGFTCPGKSLLPIGLNDNAGSIKCWW